VETRWRTKYGRIIEILLSSAPLNPDDWAEGVTFTALEVAHRTAPEPVLQADDLQR
jgi:hypothetical protein